jgi:hypothetical protein
VSARALYESRVIRPRQSESFPITPARGECLAADKSDKAAASAPRLELLRRGITRHHCPYANHPAAATTEFAVFNKRLKMSFRTSSRRAYLSKPRMYGMTGGRGPDSKSGPRVER